MNFRHASPSFSTVLFDCLSYWIVLSRHRFSADELYKYLSPSRRCKYFASNLFLQSLTLMLILCSLVNIFFWPRQSAFRDIVLIHLFVFYLHLRLYDDSLLLDGRSIPTQQKYCVMFRIWVLFICYMYVFWNICVYI